MQEGVYRVLTLVSALVVDVPIGTNLGLLHLFWMVLCGKLLLSRGALFPGLSAMGLSDGAVRRAWAALGRGSWTSHRLVRPWARVVEAEGFWQPHATRSTVLSIASQPSRPQLIGQFLTDSRIGSRSRPSTL